MQKKTISRTDISSSIMINNNLDFDKIHLEKDKVKTLENEKKYLLNLIDNIKNENTENIEKIDCLEKIIKKKKK